MHGSAEHVFDGAAVLYLDNNMFSALVIVSEGDQEAAANSSSNSLSVSISAEPACVDSNSSGAMQTVAAVEQSTEPGQAISASVAHKQPMARVPQLQRGSPRAASLMYPVNRLLILCNPDNHKQWCALYYFPATQDGSFGMYDKHLDLLQYCWASWYPDHLKDVHVDRF